MDPNETFSDLSGINDTMDHNNGSCFPSDVALVFDIPFVSLVLGLIAIGITLSLFLLVIIGWYPDLYTAKHVCIGYSLLANLATLCTCGVNMLSAFVPTHNTCSISLVLSHLSLSLFLVSQFLVQLDFYTSIAFPFWHGEYFEEGESLMRICVATSILVVTSIGTLYGTGPLQCFGPTPCAVAPLLNQFKDGATSLVFAAFYGSLIIFTFGCSLHVLIIAVGKIKDTNKVTPLTIAAATAQHHNHVSSSHPQQIATIAQAPLGLESNGHHHHNNNNGILRQASFVVNDVGKFFHVKSRLQEFWKAFTKSFRYSLIDTVSYLLFIAPTFGLISCMFDAPTFIEEPIQFCVSFAHISLLTKKTLLLIFVLARTLQPAMLMTSDKGLKKKVGAIVSDDLED